MKTKSGKFSGKTGPYFYLIYVIGILGYALGSLRPVMDLLTPLVLFLTAASALAGTYYDSDAKKRNKLVLWCMGVVVFTIFLEILGVQYGLFFGEYEYGRVLGPAIMGVPLIIGINWLIVVMGSASLVRKHTSNILLVSAASGFIAFLFDFLMEPAAISLGFWEWSGPIPLKNYVSWFAITFISSGLAAYFRIDISEKWTPVLLKSQVVFFLFIRLFMVMKLF